MEWIDNNPLGFVFGVFYGLAFVVDLFLKFSGKRSISEWIWYLTENHPTLYSLGFIITGWSVYVCWEHPLLIALNCYVAGHLFSGVSSGIQEKVQIKQMLAQAHVSQGDLEKDIAPPEDLV